MDEGKEQDPVILSPIEVRGQTYQMTGVSMGNPHTVVYLEDVQGMAIEEIGPAFEQHERFPNRINTEFGTGIGSTHGRNACLGERLRRDDGMWNRCPCGCRSEHSK